MTKAIRIHANGGPEVLRWEEVALPPPGAGEARVRHTAIGINYSDVNVRRGGFYLARPLRFPVILGNEAAGVVESVGPGVTDVRSDDRVAVLIGDPADDLAGLGGQGGGKGEEPENREHEVSHLDLLRTCAWSRFPTGA